MSLRRSTRIRNLRVAASPYAADAPRRADSPRRAASGIRRSLQREPTVDEPSEAPNVVAGPRGRSARTTSVSVAHQENGAQGLNRDRDQDQDQDQEQGQRRSPAVWRLCREMAEITANPTDGCQVEIVEDDIKHWLATILGPTGTPYEGGQFELDFFFPEEYPHVPPEVAFRTKIYHCNVSTFGSICMDILADNWSPVLTVEKLLLSIMSLMSDANPDDPMDLEMAQLYKSNREHYDQNARYWTMRYATPASVFEPF